MNKYTSKQALGYELARSTWRRYSEQSRMKWSSFLFLLFSLTNKNRMGHGGEPAGLCIHLVASIWPNFVQPRSPSRGPDLTRAASGCLVGSGGPAGVKQAPCICMIPSHVDKHGLLKKKVDKHGLILEINWTEQVLVYDINNRINEGLFCRAPRATSRPYSGEVLKYLGSQAT